MPESVCEELLDELFDDPLLSFADYLSLRRRKRIAKGFDYDDLLKPFTFSEQFFQSQPSAYDVLAHRFSLTVLTYVRKFFEKVAQF